MLVDLLTPEPSVQRRTAFAWPLVLYGLTGFAGVLAEQGFEKYIALLVGATAFSSAIVIFAYFLGFSLGGWAVAELVRRGTINRPLLVYGVLELLVGVSCVAFSYGFHPLIAHLAPFQSVSASALQKFAARFSFGAILILPSAGLMGASFPLIACAVDTHGAGSGRRWIWAYGSNLAGAVVAALGGAYLVLPALGVRGSMWLCLAVGVLVFGACLRLSGTLPLAGETKSFRASAEPLDGGKMLLAAAFLSGLIFFALEVLWTHLISTLLGSSVYAFSSMLAAVLIGLFLGAMLAQRTAETQRPHAFSRLFQLSALLLIIQFRLWDYSQAIFLIQLPDWIKSFYTIEGFKFLLGAVLIVPPAALLGMLYPMLLRSPALARPEKTYFLGYLNMANSVGCLVGTLLGILFFIPVLGSEWSLKVIAILLLGLGLTFLWTEHPPRRVFLKAVAGGVLVLGYACSWNWNRVLLTSGLNVHFGQTDQPSSTPGVPNQAPGADMVFFEEDAQGGFTTVMEIGSQGKPTKRMLLSNGKYEGSDDLENQSLAQISFAALPAQFIRDFERTLLVGLGTGQTAHALAQVGFRSMDIAEFSPGIVHAAERCFFGINGRVLDEPNVHLHEEDGRNFLVVAQPQSFDVVSIEINSVWFAGATNLYSKEFYELAKSRLRPGGAFQQWLQFHHVSPREIAVEIATLRSVFPYVSLWSSGGQGMLIATDYPQTLTPERRAYLEQRLAMFTNVPASSQTALREQVFDSRLLDPDAIDRLVMSGDQRINTDQNRWIEYATPRYNWTDKNWEDSNVAWLKSFASGSEVTAGARVLGVHRTPSGSE
jgi:spermidine synthase